MSSYHDKPWLKYYEPAVPAHLDYPQAVLHGSLEDSARRYGGRTALRFVVRYLAGKIPIGSRITYSQLNQAADRFATLLYHLGVRKGDRVALALPNCPQFVFGFYGTLKIGATVVNTNPLYTAPELKSQLVDSGATVLVLLRQIFPRYQEIRTEVPVEHVLVTGIEDWLPWHWRKAVARFQKSKGDWVDIPQLPRVHLLKDWMRRYPPAPPEVPVHPKDIALFQYTGGTTGVPKGAMLTHLNLVANVRQVIHWMPNLRPEEEHVLGALPFFHVYGMTSALCFGIALGADIVVLPTPRPIDFVIQALQNEAITVFPGVPAMYIGINNHPRVRSFDLRSIKVCISGSAPLPIEVQEKFGELTGGRLVEGYGLTEAAPVTHCNPIFGRRKAGSIGIPLPDVECKVVDLETRREVPVGDEGELAIRGPQIMFGYWNRPEETSECLDKDGWLYTGDVARMDEEGYFYIVDRKKDIIIASGFKIVPREVEEVLFKHPKVLEAVVVGVPDPYRGETVKAFVVPKAGETLTEQELQEHCRRSLAAFKVPKFIEFRKELPKTTVGKFLRRVLVEEEKTKREASP